MSSLSPPTDASRLIFTYPAVLFAPLGIGYDGRPVDLDQVSPGWWLAGSALRAEVRTTLQTRVYTGRMGSPPGVRRVTGSQDGVSLVVEFAEQDISLFGLLFSFHKYGGSAFVAPQVQATPVGEISDFAALLVLDYEAESGVMKQNTVYFPHLVSMSRLSLDPARQPLSYTMEAMAIADTVGMPDGDQIVTTHMFFSGFTQ